LSARPKRKRRCDGFIVVFKYFGDDVIVVRFGNAHIDNFTDAEWTRRRQIGDAIDLGGLRPKASGNQVFVLFALPANDGFVHLTYEVFLLVGVNVALNLHEFIVALDLNVFWKLFVEVKSARVFFV